MLEQEHREQYPHALGFSVSNGSERCRGRVHRLVVILATVGLALDSVV